jgi:hypothetical protein
VINAKELRAQRTRRIFSPIPKIFAGRREKGSGLPYVSKTGRSLIVQAGTLNEVFASNPIVRHIFWSERAAWYDAAAAAGHHERFPE